ncbi:MAG: hypothetical protein K0S78_4782 [Thermomicrobiales bacterium]|jgi:hypothetical protein|nr:hypothetical protein [Thermomicrobiales bacterium]
MLAVLQESFWERLAGVVGLKRATYEGIRRDDNATSQSWWIILLLGLNRGIALITPLPADAFADLPEDIAQELEALAAQFKFETTDQQVLGIAASMGGLILTWYLTSWLLTAIGNRLARQAGQQATVCEMRRLVAWGYAPSLAWYLLPIPIVGLLLALLGWFWSLVTGIMAVRVAFGVGIGQAIVIRVAAFLAAIAVAFLVAVVLTTLALMLG